MNTQIVRNSLLTHLLENKPIRQITVNDLLKIEGLTQYIMCGKTDAFTKANMDNDVIVFETNEETSNNESAI